MYIHMNTLWDIVCRIFDPRTHEGSENIGDMCEISVVGIDFMHSRQISACALFVGISRGDIFIYYQEDVFLF